MPAAVPGSVYQICWTTTKWRITYYRDNELKALKNHGK